MSSDPVSRNLCCAHLPDSDQVVDKVPGSVGLSVLLVGGVSHPDVVEAIDADLNGGEFRSGHRLEAKDTEEDVSVRKLTSHINFCLFLLPAARMS